jgi:glycerol-3-phosphate dehydrogenase
VGLYGSEAPEIFAAGGGPAIEARHAVLHEGALTLEDYWVRRSARAWFDTDGGLGALAPAAEAMAGLLGWSETETQRQISLCQTTQRDNLAALEDA